MQISCGVFLLPILTSRSRPYKQFTAINFDNRASLGPIFTCYEVTIKKIGLALLKFKSKRKLDAYLRSLGLYVEEKLWFCCTQFCKDFFAMMVYLVTVSVSVC